MKCLFHSCLILFFRGRLGNRQAVYHKALVQRRAFLSSMLKDLDLCSDCAEGVAGDNGQGRKKGINNYADKTIKGEPDILTIRDSFGCSPSNTMPKPDRSDIVGRWQGLFERTQSVLDKITFDCHL